VPTTTSPRRSRPPSCSSACGRFCVGPPAIHAGELTVDIARRLVTVGGEQVSLTPTEFEILALLVQNAVTLVTR
jgi:DNA-binding response OmpR family regulator